MVLREIANFSSTGRSNHTILESLKFRKHSVKEIDAIIEACTVNSRNPGDQNITDNVLLKLGNSLSNVNIHAFHRALQFLENSIGNTPHYFA